jgi:hypothetical protein
MWVRSQRLTATYHLIVTCISQIDRLLRVIASGSGVKLRPEFNSTLNTYTDLRDVFEHLDNRLPGKSKEHELTRHLPMNGGIRFIWGFDEDEFGATVFGEKTARLFSDAFAQLNVDVEQFLKDVHAKILNELWSNYESNSANWQYIDVSEFLLKRRLGGGKLGRLGTTRH